jgi:hypothetical protein
LKSNNNNNNNNNNNSNNTLDKIFRKNKKCMALPFTHNNCHKLLNIPIQITLKRKEIKKDIT